MFSEEQREDRKVSKYLVLALKPTCPISMATRDSKQHVGQGYSLKIGALAGDLDPQDTTQRISSNFCVCRQWNESLNLHILEQVVV